MEYFLEILLALIACHFIGDYVFQTDAIALGKNHKLEKENGPKFGVSWIYWMTSHAITHAALVYIVTQDIYIFIIEFVSHFLIDYAKCSGWIDLSEDQFLHIFLKFFYVFIIFSRMVM